MDLAAGVQLSRYTLERQIGAGGMGAVWAARDSRTGRSVAVKFLAVTAFDVEVTRIRFIREARASQRITHPAIVPVLDVLEYGGSPVLVMELLQGETLGTLIAREHSLSIARAGSLLLPIAEALAEAHAAGIAHRDLKPENIFIETLDEGERRTRLLDFGVARYYEPRAGFEQTPITELNAVVGTLAYMAPEQALRPSEIDHRADIWALGVTMYEALGGCRPIEGETGPEMMRQLLVGGITPLAVLKPDLPRDVLELVGSMLTRDPDKRPGNLSPAIEILRRYAA